MPEQNKLDGLRIDRRHRTRTGGRAWVVVVAVLVGVIAVVAWLSGRPDTIEVRTATAREIVLGGRSTVLNASGYVTARRKATVSSKVTGKVLEVLIEEGQAVKEGQVVARLDASNLQVSMRLFQARSVAAEKALAETAVRIREAELEHARVVNLVRQEVASKAELDRAEAEVDSLKARLETQREQVAVADREVAVWQQQLDDTVIRAPFSGVVVSKDAQPGEMISPISAGGGFTRTGIGTVVDMASLEIEVDVNESYIKRVSAGQPVAAVLDAYPDWDIPARVIAIVPTADRQKATVRVRIAFIDLDPRILPDMGVKVAFQESKVVEDRRAGVAVPAEAVASSGQQEIVFVVNGTTVERRAVRVLTNESDGETVISGLAAGEIVVLEPPPELAEGDVVEVQG